MKKRFLLFCSSLLVCSSAFVSFSNNAVARDVVAGPIYNNNQAKSICPAVCGSRNWKWTGQWRTTVLGSESVCGCGEWRLDTSRLLPTRRKINVAELYKYRDFKTAIEHRGLHPKDAAASWDSNYKKLQGNQYQIRLSQNNRVTFIVDNQSKVVYILQVGGHTK